jgi:hypothetical protein
VKKQKRKVDQPHGSTRRSKNLADILDVYRADKGDAVITDDFDRSTGVAYHHRPTSGLGLSDDRNTTVCNTEEDRKSSGSGDCQPAIAGSADVRGIGAIGIASSLEGVDEGSGSRNKHQRMWPRALE